MAIEIIESTRADTAARIRWPNSDLIIVHSFQVSALVAQIGTMTGSVSRNLYPEDCDQNN
ncbi:MAG TPA: hypothetical protein DCS24_04135 [Erythrobacter sp.]|nr:hypothetical protein [Erythrobacter sp.]